MEGLKICDDIVAYLDALQVYGEDNHIQENEASSKNMEKKIKKVAKEQNKQQEHQKKINRKKDSRLSRGLSKILRHKALEFGLNISNEGYVSLESMMKLDLFQNATFDDIKHVVDSCEKKRFALQQKENKWYIRANQGHSIKCVNASIFKEEITSSEQLPVCIHGSYLKFWQDGIRKFGLNKMGRNNIHFTPSEAPTEDARSGFRSSCNLLIYLDVELSLKDGLKLYRSQNNVILSPGFDGIIPNKYFLFVKNRKTGRIMFQNATGRGSNQKIVSNFPAFSLIKVLKNYDGVLAFRGAPGKKSILPYWEPATNITCIITLQQKRESHQNNLNLESITKERGIKWFMFPISGRSFDQENDRELVIEAAYKVKEMLEQGERIVLHCSAGCHRTGTVGYVMLRICGFSVEDSIHMLKKIREVTHKEMTKPGTYGVILVDLAEEFFQSIRSN